MKKTHSASAAVLAVSAALLLGGCGKSEPAAAVSPRPAAVKSVDEGESAEQVAKRARGDVACPVKPGSPPRADNAPADDVLGVRPGLGYDEAVNVVLCANPLLVATLEPSRGFDIKNYGQKLRQGFSARFAEPRVVKTGKEIVQDMQRDASARGMNAVREDLKPGQSKWYVGTMGVPGQERVLSVGREERFASGQNPTIDTVRAALLKKYGPATRESGGGTQLPALRWAHDPAGQPVAPGTPLANRCVGHPDSNVGVNVNPDCGVVVEALLIPQKTNPELVDRLQVSIVNQAEGYRMLQATEQALALLDQQRRNAEVDKAAKGGKAPSL
jgi:hypothetical protein